MIPLSIASRTVTVASGSLQDDDGIKTAVATSTSPVVYLPANFDGPVISNSTGQIIGLARVLTITRSNAASQYSITPIVVTGVRGGNVITESVTPPNINGNDVLATVSPFERIISISIPAQGGTGGQFKFGVRDLCANAGDRFIGVEAAAAGTLYVQYGEGANPATDAIVIPAALIGYVKPIGPSRILTDPAKTTVGVTVYLP